MTDNKTMAYINMFAVLGTLENLCDLDPKAKEILKGTKPVSIGFDVKDGPKATIDFEDGKCTVTEGCADCDIKLPFSSVDKFNGMIDGTVTPIPSKGFTKIGFLTKTFIALTDRLEEVMRPSEEALKDPDFFNLSTTLTFYTIAAAISQLGNHDPISKFSASNIDDGNIKMSIKGGPKAIINSRNHILTTYKEANDSPRALMEFGSMQLAYDLFNGNVNSLACIGEGTIRMGGMASMLDNMNRILDRVSVYLA
ncbi:MAG: SCP2 sterol-binding domain-containing protein [Clostridiales bacterium]|nr:SCP2 sterol-binding domain-containing protein [Clostridiales bacterium]